MNTTEPRHKGKTSAAPELASQNPADVLIPKSRYGQSLGAERAERAESQQQQGLENAAISNLSAI